MMITGEVSLVGGGQQAQAGTQEFLYQENEKQNYLLLLCNQRTLLHINQKQYYMQPFTFLLMPFGGKPLSLETQGITFYRYLHFQCDEILINELLRHGFSPAEPYPMARPLDIECIWRMLFPVAQTGNISQELEESAMKLLLCLLMMPSDGAATRAAEIPHYDRLTSLRYRIYQYPAQSWYIQDICDEMGISRTYFHRIYSAAFGTTCTQDVIASRIARSRTLLEITDSPVSLIAQQSGFETDVYFLRQFKRHVGMTPTAYRRVFRQENPEAGSS